MIVIIVLAFPVGMTLKNKTVLYYRCLIVVVSVFWYKDYTHLILSCIKSGFVPLRHSLCDKKTNKQKTKTKKKQKKRHNLKHW